MPDFREFVRKDVESLNLPPDREIKVIEEVADQIEDVYACILDEGFSEDAAWLELQNRIPPLHELLDQVQAAEPALARAVRRQLRAPAMTANGAPASRFVHFLESGFWLDLKTTLRRLAVSRTFAATAVVTLAVCLGANAAIFTIIDQVLLNPLPVSDPSRIMLVANQFPNTELRVAGETSSARNYYHRRKTMSAFSEQAMFRGVDLFVGPEESVSRLHGMAVTPSLLRLLGVNAAVGRTFTDDEGEIGSDDRVVLSHGLWLELFAGDPAAIGAGIRIAGRRATIVGVMPDGFSFFDPNARFWIPAALTPAEQNNSANNNWYHIGRLAPGATLGQARAQARLADATFLESAPFLRETYKKAGYHSTVEPLEEVLVGRTGGVLYLLWGGAIVLLLIGGINIANLTLARSHLRVREIVTRMALGAGRTRLAGLFVTEGLLLSMTAGVVGILVGVAALRLAALLNLNRLLTLAGDLEIRGVVIAFVLGLSAIVGLAIGIVPLENLYRLDLGPALLANNRSGTLGPGARLLRKALVTGEVSLTFVLLVAAGLLVATLANLLSVDPGFSGQNVVTAAIEVQGKPGNAAAQALLDRSLKAIRTVPGIAAAAATTVIPLSGKNESRIVFPEGAVPASQDSLIVPTSVRVSPGFFDTMNAPLIRGRDFDDRDSAAIPLVPGNPGQGVVIVDEALAKMFWPGEDAVGKRLFIPGTRNTAEVRPNTRWLTVVGVAPELRLVGLAVGESPGTFYTLHGEANLGDYPTSYGFVIRTVHDAPLSVMPHVRRALSAIDASLVLFDVQTMDQRTALSVERERLAMWLSASFGMLALFLSAVGVYGVLSFLVTQRMREMGIRVALGCTRGQVFKLVVRDAIGLVAAGLILGLAGTLMLRSILERLVYGIRADNPALIVAISAILVSVVVLASLFPAHRATRVDPIDVLCEE